MSKQPPAPILKMDLLSSAIAGDATPHRVQATAVFDPTDIHAQEALSVASSPATGCLPCLPLVCPLSPPVQAFAARSPLLAGIWLTMHAFQVCRSACGSAKCGSRLPLNASFAFDPLVRYKVPDVGAVVTQAQDKVSLLPLPRRVTHTRIGSCKFGACS